MPEELLSTRQAIKFLADIAGLSVQASRSVITRHLYKTHKLVPDNREPTGELRFSKATLRAFAPLIGRRGRPPRKP